MTHRRNPSPATLAAIVCWTLFIAACALPALRLEGRDEAWPGVSLLLLGWLGLFALLDGEVYALGWLANPLFLLATLSPLIRTRRLGLMAGLAASGLALASFTVRELTVNEAGHTRAVVGYGPGFWLWLTAIGLSALAPVILPAEGPRDAEESATPLVFDDELPSPA